MSQSTIKLKAITQLAKVLKSSTFNSGNYVVNISKDFYVLLRYIPEGIAKTLAKTIPSPSATSSASAAPISTSIRSPAEPLKLKVKPNLKEPEPALDPNLSSLSSIEQLEIKYNEFLTTTPSISINKSTSVNMSSTSEEVKGNLSRTTTTTIKNENGDLNDIKLSDLPLEYSTSPKPPPNNKPEEKVDKSKIQILPLLSEEINKSSLNLETVKMFETNLQWQNLEARTKYLLSSIARNIGNSQYSMVHNVEDLYNHVYTYPDTRAVAVENGGIKILTKLVNNHENDAFILNKSREILAILGWNPPVKGRGIKILSIDGGGTRGLVAIEVLRMIENITGKRTFELFDYICGVSTGALLAFLLGAQRKSLNDVEALYKDLSIEIFGSQNSFFGSASLLWNQSYYHTPSWEKMLKKNVGDMALISLAKDPQLPRVSAISTVVNHDRVVPHVFRTYTFPPGRRSKYIGGFKYAIWEACRASAAAPTYFEEIKLGNYLHQDGGVGNNNPCSIAISEAKTIWQGVPLQCVVSLGTGTTLTPQLDKNLTELVNLTEEGMGMKTTNQNVSSLSWKGKFLKMLDSATDTQTVHNALNELLPHDVYFRLDPYLSQVTHMDEWKAEKLDQVKKESRDYLERNYQKVKFLSDVLVKEKSIMQKISDKWYY